MTQDDIREHLNKHIDTAYDLRSLAQVLSEEYHMSTCTAQNQISKLRNRSASVRGFQRGTVRLPDYIRVPNRYRSIDINFVDWEQVTHVMLMVDGRIYRLPKRSIHRID